MGTVRQAVIEHVRAKNQESNQAWQDTHHYDEPRLFVSDIGHCPRAAYYSAFGHFEGHPFCVERTHPFDDYVVEILRAGYVWEHQTGLALRHALDGAVHWQKDDLALEVQNGIWLWPGSSGTGTPLHRAGAMSHVLPGVGRRLRRRNGFPHRDERP